MVDIENIEYILNKTITQKCRRNKLIISNSKYNIKLNTETRKVITDFTEKVKGSNTEHLIVFDKEGNIVFEKEGNENSVILNDDEEEFLKTLKGNEYIEMHNHPVNNFNKNFKEIVDTDGYHELNKEMKNAWKSKLNPCFSGGDIVSFMEDEFCETAIVVSSDNGSRMIISKTKDYKDSFNEDKKNSKFYRNIMVNPFRIEEEFGQYFQELGSFTRDVIIEDLRVNDGAIAKKVVSKLSENTKNPELYVLEEYERLGKEKMSSNSFYQSFEERFGNMRQWYNSWGIELSVEY